VSPTSIQDQIQVGKSKTYQISIQNTENGTTFYLNKSGDIASWIYFSTTSIYIDASETKTIEILIQVPENAAEGTYTGSIGVWNGTTLKTISVNITVIKWVYSQTYWFNEGDTITIQPFNFQFKITNVGREVVTTVGNFSVGDTKLFSNNNIELTLLDRYEDQARFRIRTTEQSTTISVEHEAKEEEETTLTEGCKLEPLINRYVLSVQKDTVTRRVVTVRNSGDYEITLKDMVLEDVIQTSTGTKPISVQASLGTLAPGSEVTLTVAIDTRGLDIGVYTPAIILVGYCNNERVEARVNFDLTVIEKLEPETFDVSITGPTQAEAGKDFTITLSGIPEGATIVPGIPQGITEVSHNLLGGTYTWVGRASNAGTYTITFQITKGETSITKTWSIQITAPPQPKNLRIDIFPPAPLAGQSVTIAVRDHSTGQIVSNAEITVTVKDVKTLTVVSQFQYTGSFQVQAGKQYCITASAPGYQQATRCFTVTQQQQQQPTTKTMRIEITPEEPVEGDDVTITVVDTATGREVQGVTIKINDVTYHENPVILEDVASGTMMIVATAPGYAQVQKNVNVAQKPSLLSRPQKFTYGATVSWVYNGPVSWELLLNNETLLTGRDSNITITLLQEGTYTLIAAGEVVDTFTVRKGFFSSISLGNIGKAVIGILVLLFVISLVIRRRETETPASRKLRRIAKLASMRPRRRGEEEAPPGSVPLEEEEVKVED